MTRAAKMVRQLPGKSRTRTWVRLTIGAQLALGSLPLRILASVSTRFEGWVYSVTGARGASYVLAIDTTGVYGRLYSPDGRKRWDVDGIQFLGAHEC